jgi:hypothetical protein
MQVTGKIRWTKSSRRAASPTSCHQRLRRQRSTGLVPVTMSRRVALGLWVCKSSATRGKWSSRLLIDRKSSLTQAAQYGHFSARWKILPCQAIAPGPSSGIPLFARSSETRLAQCSCGLRRTHAGAVERFRDDAVRAELTGCHYAFVRPLDVTRSC